MLGRMAQRRVWLERLFKVGPRPHPVPDYTPPPQPLGPDIWVIDRQLGLGSVRMQYRMTVVRLRSGGLWLHAPASLDPALSEELAHLGPVEAIVAPNTFHYFYPQERVAKQISGFGAAMDNTEFLCHLTSQGTKTGERVLLKLESTGLLRQ